MSSQFFGLNTAYTGLLAANAALNTTANNIANVQTDGYSRQQVKQEAADAIRVFQKYGAAGAGVETLAIERVHDDFYDNKYWANNSSTGEYTDKAYYMKQIETYFTDSTSTPGFTTIFDQTVSALQEVMKDAGGTTTKAQYISSMSSLTDYFNNLYGNLQELQKDVNAEIKLNIDEINSIAAEIASVNKQINVIEMGGGTANELRDKRTLLVDELSSIVNVTVQEDPVVDPNYPDEDTGATRCIVYIAGGQTLVDGSDYNSLVCVAKKSYEKDNQTDITGLYDVYWATKSYMSAHDTEELNDVYRDVGQKVNRHSSVLGGSLQGLIAIRDGNNNENFNGVVAADGIGTTEINGVKYDTVTIDVDDDYLQDLNKCNLSDSGGKLNIGNQIFYYDSWSVTKTYDALNDEYNWSYTFVLSDETKNSQTITNDRIGKEAKACDAIDYQGIPYYMEQMNEWVRSFAESYNDILNSGYDTYGNNGYNLLTGDHATDDEQYDFSQGIRLDGTNTGTFDERLNATADNTVSSYYWLTAGNFNINASFHNDADLLATRDDASNGVDDYSTLERLNSMFSDKDQMSFRGCSASEFLECILSDVALNASEADTFSASYTQIGTAIDNQRLSISGVDEDEEAVDLVKYQNAYNLASRMIQTLTEVYDRLILYTGT